jgi:23S rRNA G2069 N7-methylase RlmK/C1962 C5-methylase RlmI
MDLDEKKRLQSQLEMLVNRTQKNVRRLKSWAHKEGVTCYRMYDRDIPEVPLVIDWYEGKLHIAVYARGGDLPGDKQVERLVSGLAEHFGVSADNVFVKVRQRQRKGNQYRRFAQREALFQVAENKLKFTVNLSDYLDTGLFLDHRGTRKMVREEARGKQFLNLFSYTGAFTVYAAAGGAASTVSVDLSNTYLNWAEHNLEQNGYRGENHRFFKNDVFSFLENHRPPNGGYDLVVIDPPTMSRSKSMVSKLDLQQDHPRMLNQALDLCKTGAVIYFSTNFRKFKLNREEINCNLQQEITDKTIPVDFRDKRIHRCFRLMK